MTRSSSIKPRKHPVQERSKATVDAIIEGSAQVLRQRGWEQSTVAQIAERAGVSQGSLYQYFPTKDALLAAVMRRHVEEMTALLGQTLGDCLQAPLEDAIDLLVQASVTAHQHDPDLHRVLSEQAARLGQLDFLQTFEARMIRALEGLLLLHAEQLNLQQPRAAAFVLVHSVEAIIHRALLEPNDHLAWADIEAELETMLKRYLLGST